MDEIPADEAKITKELILESLDANPEGFQYEQNAWGRVRHNEWSERFVEGCSYGKAYYLANNCATTTGPSTDWVEQSKWHKSAYNIFRSCLQENDAIVFLKSINDDGTVEINDLRWVEEWGWNYILTDTIFTDCDFEGARFQDCNFDNVQFVRCSLINAVFENCSMIGVRYTDCTR